MVRPRRGRGGKRKSYLSDRYSSTKILGRRGLRKATHEKPLQAVRPQRHRVNSDATTMAKMPDVSEFFAKKNSSPYIMQQTMVRCKDPIKSLKFYTEILKMNLLSASDFPQWGFSVYFVGYVDPATLPADTANRWEYVSKIPGTVELTWNHGSESVEA